MAMSVNNFTDASERSAVAPSPQQRKPPLIVHIIHRLAVGGLENGLINLVNVAPPERYRHAIVSLTDYTDFRARIERTDTPVIALHKRTGKDFRTHLRLWRVLRDLQPDIVHTRNLPALEYLVVAAAAGVRGRIHGEHGRDVYDLDGSSFKYNLLRKTVRPFTSYYTAVSADLSRWLIHTVGVPPRKVHQIYNGVDIERFHPRSTPKASVGPPSFARQDTVIIGTVGRMQLVKDQLTLVRAFLHLIQNSPEARQNVRLIMIGDGPLREESRKLLQAAQADALAWLPGERSDVPELMRSLDLFVLPSLAEGISNTILEAMASGLPVIATRVGGNSELVEEGETGMLVPAADPQAMARAIASYLADRRKLIQHGQAGRRTVKAKFSIAAMVNGYLAVYDSVLSTKRVASCPADK